MNILVTGSSGFIGGHLVSYLKKQGHFVRGLDIKRHEFRENEEDEFFFCDLREPDFFFFEDIDEVYHLAADMGGIGYIETHKADIVYNNTMINMNVLKMAQECRVKKFLFASSACVYPSYLQDSEKAQLLREEDAYPAQSEDGYGWEKLMMERACRHFYEDYDLKVYLPRFHNIYGPYGTYEGGREKSPAALCRKIAQAKTGDSIEIWGDGFQTRSYCYVSDCVEALYRLMQTDYHDPINIGTDRLVSISELAMIIEKISGKSLGRHYDLSKPQGVKGRNADLTKAKQILNWKPQVKLEDGLKETYQWIHSQICPS